MRREQGAAATSAPSWIHLHTIAHVGTCVNATTARTVTGAGSPIEVSLVLADDPPGVSSLVVSCPDLIPAERNASPVVAGADGAFFLIRVLYIDRHERRFKHPTDVFLYRAAACCCPGAPPSLCFLPGPYPHFDHVGVLSDPTTSNNNDCLVVVPTAFSYYDLQPVPGADLMCDVAGNDDPEMRLVPLPPLTPVNEEDFMPDSFGCAPSLRCVTCRDGWFRLVEMEMEVPDGTTGGHQFPWTAVTYKRPVWSDSDTWDRGANRLTLHNVMTSDPALDLYRDDMFYVAAKLADDDTNGWFLAANARSNKLEQVVPFFDDRAFFDHNYLLCVLSQITSV
ncbi:hypothetical protein QOZ80_2BG0192250 [Eleusine coracana subsp. coracana]|nr:hypothetical protein QOZ80_2BG0192250 [Eleusine coracana subsp. coracana]